LPNACCTMQMPCGNWSRLNGRQYHETHTFN
jgi:hypothetical protein